jgi:hypothetical protein
MASVVVNGDTSGAVTLTAPAVAGTVTVTLPSTSGTMAVLPTATGVLAESAGGTGTTTGYYGFKNRIINGAMVVDQRNAGASVSVSTANVYVLDRWKNRANGGGVFSVQQSSTAPTGFTNSSIYTVTTADSSIAAGDNYWIVQEIEGYNVADLGFGTADAKTVTFSFWVRSSVTGTFNVALSNGTTYNRSYVTTYTINSANTWEQKSVTIAGDTSGTWGTTNGGGITAVFTLGAGSDYQATANTWVAGFKHATSGSTNLIATNGATFYITGVQLEKGSTATSFDYRPYGTELSLCQRYFARMTASATYTGLGIGLFSGTTAGSIFFKYPITMRSSPTINQSNCAFNTLDTAFAVTSVGTTFAGTDAALQAFNIASGGTQYRPAVLTANNNTAAYVDFSSEL